MYCLEAYLAVTNLWPFLGKKTIDEFFPIEDSLSLSTKIGAFYKFLYSESYSNMVLTFI